jgi:hypothetical protein
MTFTLNCGYCADTDECPLAEAGQADAKWFASRPTRSFRLRPATDGELACLGPPAEEWHGYIVVRQVAVGERVRIPFAAPTRPPRMWRSERGAKITWQFYAQQCMSPETLSAIDGRAKKTVLQ